ncbi:hypothetical protein PTH_1557 [Pelotomaculum thermopropionicum SI]|uniref:YcdB/YcdC repeated domain-containing protein n=1 Tax=Pelotomaculum thermopropionicum (strain DSM 13744 / JCM 10971 / SI) TaxID=370438 RepID=A5D206_PELTS|nr:hypothetical protein PTH_1557 [Pelotomaculum thermopropionicum SI]
MFKRTTAAVLTVGMLLATPAWAAEKEASSVQEVKGGVEIVQSKSGTAGQPVPKVELNEKQRQALEKIYQIVPELKELSVESVHDEGEAAWGVTLSDRAGETAPGIMHAYAILVFETDTGELISLDIQNPDWASVELPPPGLAKEKAAEFARQVLGDKMKDYQMSDEISHCGGGSRDDKGNEILWNYASVQFYRLVNGIPLLNSGFRVNVDVAGHVTEYYTEGFYEKNDGAKDGGPDPALFPDPSQAMTREAAEKTFAGLLEMKLNYVERQPLKYPVFGSKKVETRPVLMYTPLNYTLIDAVTGKPLDGFQEQPQTSRISLVGEGRKLIAGTPEEAASLLAGEVGIDMTGMNFENVEEREALFAPEVKIKEYYWRSEPQIGPDGRPDHSTMRFLHLSAVADTGRVVGFNLQDESGRGKKAVVSREAAQETAVQFMQRYLDKGAAELEMHVYPLHEESIPEWVDKSKLEGDGQRPEFHFTFTRTHQGIPVSDRSYSVTVDGLTGRITAFYDGNSSSAVALPDSKNVVTAEAAKAEFLKSHPLRLFYLWPEYFGQKAPNPLLVYMPDYGGSWGYIDALTGKTVRVEMN